MTATILGRARRFLKTAGVKSTLAIVVVFLSGWACGVRIGWPWNGGAAPLQAVQWHENLDSACRLAAETNRLVLVHFWTDSCATCRRMDCDIFSRPDVASAIEAHFVPVRINARHFPAMAWRFGVSSWPSDVVVTPQQQILERLSGGATAEAFVTRMIQIAMTAPRPSAPPVRQLAVAPLPPASGPGPSALPPPGDAVPARQTNVGGGPPAAVASPARDALSEADPRGPLAAPAYVPTNHGDAELPADPPEKWPALSLPAGAEARNLPARRSAPPADGPAAGGSPPVALDGYCAVTLAQRKRWVKGDRRWGVVHGGQTYLFCGPEEARQFYGDPESYAPVAAGIDLVAAVERDQAVPGRREHGTWYAGRLYLFASETTHQMFERYPQRYVSAALPTPAGSTAGNAVGRY